MTEIKVNDFDHRDILVQPLMAFLATTCNEGPRDSPVWFIWEQEKVWVYGFQTDSFMKRLKADPRCALSVVEFNPLAGILKHVGIRGKAQHQPRDYDRLLRMVAKYLGDDQSVWNPWFVENIINGVDAMVAITPSTIVNKDDSFIKNIA